MTEVIIGASIVLASNAIMEWLVWGRPFCPTPNPKPPEPDDRLCRVRWSAVALVVDAEMGLGGCAESAVSDRRRTACDKASPAAAVMLHLRSCYVSKAAILTIPVQPVPVENRSPA